MKKILIAEDAKFQYRLLGKYLQGYEFLHAETGSRAAVMYPTHRKELDLIMMDMLMPVMNGEQAIKLIRTYEKNHDIKPIPIIAMSADEKYRQVAKDAGANIFFQKPYTRKDIRRIVEYAINGRNKFAVQKP